MNLTGKVGTSTLVSKEFKGNSIHKILNYSTSFGGRRFVTDIFLKFVKYILHSFALSLGIVGWYRV